MEKHRTSVSILAIIVYSLVGECLVILNQTIKYSLLIDNEGMQGSCLRISVDKNANCLCFSKINCNIGLIDDMLNGNQKMRKRF